MGSHRLKDLKDPEHLFQVVHSVLLTDFLPLKSLNVLPNNLPMQLTSFIGREREMTELKRLLPITLLLTLTGRAVAARLGWPCGSRPTSSKLIPTACGWWVKDHPGAPGGALGNVLRPKPLLLVLDNYEHLLDPW